LLAKLSSSYSFFHGVVKQAQQAGSPTGGQEWLLLVNLDLIVSIAFLEILSCFLVFCFLLLLFKKWVTGSLSLKGIGLMM
jgi:hypothetical protein